MSEKLCHGPLCKGNVEKTLSQFEPDPNSPDGYGDICEACRTYIQLENELKGKKEERMDDRRTCKKCGTAKPQDQYYESHPYTCKACVLAHQKAMKKKKVKAAGADVEQRPAIPRTFGQVLNHREGKARVQPLAVIPPPAPPVTSTTGTDTVVVDRSWRAVAPQVIDVLLAAGKLDMDTVDHAAMLILLR